jgi:hypothetical protein
MRRNNHYYKLPDPYIPPFPQSDLQYAASSGLAAGTWPAADRAILVPVYFPANCTLYSLMFVAGNGTGNYDLGFYDQNYGLIVSSGSTAMSAGIKTLTLPEFRARVGQLYHAALALSSAAGSVVRYLPTSAEEVSPLGVAQQASAFPLPDPFVPAKNANSQIPKFAFGVR